MPPEWTLAASVGLAVLIVVLLLDSHGQVPSSHPRAPVVTAAGEAPTHREPGESESARLTGLPPPARTDPEPAEALAMLGETRVVEAGTGTPVAGASLRASADTVTVRGLGDGIFQLSGRRPPAGFMLIASADGYRGLPVRVDPDGPVPTQVLLHRKGVLSGILLDARATPVAGTEVGVPGVGSALTDEEGRFRFDDVPLGAEVRFQVSTNQGRLLPYDSPTLTVEAPVAEVELRLAPGLSHGVVVLAPGGLEPLEGAEVQVESLDERIPFLQLTDRTDGAGRADFNGLRQAPYRIVVRKEGYEEALVSIDAVAGSEEPVGVTRIELMRGGGHALWGRVVDEAGRGVPDVSIEVRSDAARRGQSGEDGSFRVDGLSPPPSRGGLSSSSLRNPVSVSLQKDGWYGADYEVDLDGSVTLRLTHNPASLRVRVLDPEGRTVSQPVIQFFPTYGDDSGARPRYRPTSFRAKGRWFVAEDLFPSPGTLTVRDRDAEFPELAIEVQLVAGQETDLGEVRLLRGGRLQGDIVDSSGSVVADRMARVALLRSDGRVCADVYLRSGKLDGNRRIAPGTYRAVGIVPGRICSVEAVEVRDGEQSSVRIVSWPPASLKVHAPSDGRRATVVLRAVDNTAAFAWRDAGRSESALREGTPPAELRVVLATRGVEWIRNLPPGPYQISYEIQDGNSSQAAEARVLIAEGEDADFYLDAAHR